MADHSIRDSLPMRLRGAYLTMHRAANERLEPLGLTADQYALLGVLGEVDGLSQLELTATLSSDPSTISAMVRLLAAKGWLRRLAAAEDARIRQIYLTPSGREMLALAMAAVAPLRADIAALFSTAERDQLDLGLARLADRLRPGIRRRSRPRTTRKT